MWFGRLREGILVGAIWLALLAIVGVVIHLAVSLFLWIWPHPSPLFLAVLGLLAAWGVFQLVRHRALPRLAEALEPKYFGKIEEAEAREAADPWLRPPPFRLDPVSPPGLIADIVSAVSRFVIGVVLRLYRIFAPNGRILPLSFRLVTRFEDVTAVLKDPDRYRVPFGREWTAMGGGRNSVLGMDGVDHDRQRALFNAIMGPQLWPVDQIRISTKAAEVARGVIAEADGGLDVVADVFQRTITEVCIDYLGLEAPDRAAYADWLTSKTWLTFGDPTGVPEVRTRGMQGARLARSVIERSLEVAALRPGGDTLANRLLDLEARGRLDRDESIAILDGAAGGLVPTTTLCMTRLFCELMNHPIWWDEARGVARILCSGKGTRKDRTRLQDILLEAARLAPTLYPGQWRYVETAGVIARGTLRAAAVRPGDVLMVSTAAALRDGRRFRNPDAFNPDRSPEEKRAAEIMFGDGSHKCVGMHASIEMMVEIAIALLSQEDLAPAPGDAGRLVSTGPFPRHMNMTWKSRRPVAGQQMVVIATQLPASTDIDALTQGLRNLQAAGGRKDMDRTGIVHFASFSVADLQRDAQGALWPGKPKDRKFWLVGDLNFDGARDEGLERIAAEMTGWLATFRLADPSIASTDDLARFLKKHALDIRATPWGATGLQYQGSLGLPVSDIRKQAQLAGFVRQVTDFLNTRGSLEPRDASRPAGLAPDAVQILDTVRRLIRRDPEMVMQAAGDPGITDLVLKGAEFRSLLLRPLSRRLAFADYSSEKGRDVPPLGQIFRAALSDRDRAAVLGVLLTLAVAITTVLRVVADGAPSPLSILATAVSSLVWVIALAGIATIGLVGLFLALLFAHEAAEKTDVSVAAPNRVDAVEARENAEDCAQNPMLSVTWVKPGPFRRFTLALGMWSIRLLVVSALRQGNLGRIVTVHFARWVKPPGSDALIFISNYDGSWVSYLEDFSALAPQGVNLAWGHSRGFPTARMMIFDGCTDSDSFKRFAKRSMRPTHFWYTAYPGVTLENTRRNALIHDGLLRAANATEAQDWLDLLASVKRPEREIETDEVQTLILRGLGSLPVLQCGLVSLPESADLSGWTSELARRVTFGNEDPHPDKAKLRRESGLYQLAERDLQDRAENALFVAFTASGLSKLGLPEPQSGLGLAGLLSPFHQGMSSRERILRDGGASAPANWSWSDTPWTGAPERPGAVDAVLLAYGSTIGDCERIIRDQVSAYGLTLRKLLTAPERKVDRNGLRKEPFGFADGISNPVMRGLRGNRGAPGDLVEPGEILLGYPHNRPGQTPTCALPADLDPMDILPALIGETPIATRTEYTRYPAFGRESGAGADHDFGRNGTFLVVRQLEQDVAGFHDYTRATAAELAAKPGVASVAPEWVAAKMVGRWTDGSPVVLHPDARPRTADPSNDFNYADIDPRGFACPLGSHVRRTNPRDSLDSDQPQAPNHISSHRILRRGRAYAEPAQGNSDKTEGLIFLAACADLERQFEMVQQSWLGNPSFHGLTGEADPTVDSDGKRQDLSLPDGRTVRRLKGIPDFVTVRGGGYFFMPSRSALHYLADRSRRLAGRVSRPSAPANRKRSASPSPTGEPA